MSNLTLLEFLNLFESEDILTSIVDAETNEELLRAWYSNIHDSLCGYINDFEFLRDVDYRVKGFEFMNGVLVIDVI